ncbi:hypothetical protein EV177_005426 [Coemansia sp. RSA 1804]|nr:hypothetical protein EV177_005426 [Coemansia sp. RSA 1804]
MGNLPDEFTEGRSLFYCDSREYSQISYSGIKPSGILFYTRSPVSTIDSVHVVLEANISPNANKDNEVLGQIGKYVQTVWKAQFTRKFVPVVLIHGRYLTLCIFSRKFPDNILLGSVFYPSDQPDEVEAGRIARALQNVWFLLLQPSDKFGHIVDVSKSKARYLLFGGTCKNATVAVATSETPCKVEIVDYICHSGIICADFLGNRLEYIIMEYCGDSLYTYFDDKREPNELSISARRKILVKIVQDVSAYLVQANFAGMLHHDISMGSITVRRDKVFVIDWGYARFIDRSISDHVRSHINNIWGIDVNSHSPIEKEQDPVIDTMCFMSIRMLAAAATRRLWDDFESLFYVVLGCLFAGYIGEFNHNNSPGFEHSSNKKSAIAKAGGVGASDYA